MAARHENLMTRVPRPRATSASLEWGKTLFIQSVIAIVLAFLWTVLGLQ